MSALTGYLDEAGRQTISGWAQIVGSQKPVELDVLIAATFSRPPVHLHRCLANRYRPDRDADQSLSSGRLGFALDASRLALPSWSFCLEVRRVGGQMLPGAPRLVAHASFDLGHSPFRLIEIDGEPVARLPSDILLWQPTRGGARTLTIPAGIAMVAIVTPPRDVPGEARRLGIVLRRVALDDMEIPLHSSALCQGFYPIEQNDVGHLWRWTRPVAVMDLGPSPRARKLAVGIGDPVPLCQPPRVGLGYQAVFSYTPGMQQARAPYIGRHLLTRPAHEQ